MKHFILIVSTVLLFFACRKDNNSITMTYGQTQCADKWGYSANDNETKAKLGGYLDSLRITYSNLRFAKVEPEAVCLACTCPTGGVFTFQTTEPYVKQLIDLGFQKK